MFQIFTLNNKVERLQDLALPHAVDKLLRDASKLSLRTCVDVYIYNFSGHRKIKKVTSIDFIDEKINFLVMDDDRIAIKGAECLSAVLPEYHVMHYLRDFRRLDLPMYKDKTGLYYYEKKLLPYNILKDNLTTFSDTSRWSDNDWAKYYSLWPIPLRRHFMFACFHLLRLSDPFDRQEYENEYDYRSQYGTYATPIRSYD